MQGSFATCAIVLPNLDCEYAGLPNGLNLFGEVHLSTHH
jgi:hypothetical protein